MNLFLRIAAIFVIFMLTFGLSYLVIIGFLNKSLTGRWAQVGGNNRAFARTRLQRTWDIFSTKILLKLMRFSSPKESIQEVYKKKFIVAGLRHGPWIAQYLGLKTFIAIAIPFIYLFVATVAGGTSFEDMMMVAVVMGAAGYYLPNAVLSYKIKNRKQELFDSFPDSLDLIRVCVGAGMGLDAAITRVGNEISVSSKAMADEFNSLNLELRAGLTRATALQNFAIRTDLEEVKALVSMLIQAEKYGTSVSDALLIFSEDLRNKRRLRAQELAAKIPVKLSMPIILFIFPAIFIVLLGPPMMSIMRMFH